MKGMEIQATVYRPEAGVEIYSVVTIGGEGICFLCHQDTVNTADIELSEMHRDGSGQEIHSHYTDISFCRRCSETIGGLFDRPDKELFNGIVQDRY